MSDVSFVYPGSLYMSISESKTRYIFDQQTYYVTFNKLDRDITTQIQTTGSTITSVSLQLGTHVTSALSYDVNLNILGAMNLIQSIGMMVGAFMYLRYLGSRTYEVHSFFD